MSSLPMDGGYRHIFSHPIMVEHLLRGFVPEAWAARLDFSTLDRRNGHYVADDLRQRMDDVVWRVKLNDQDRWLYVYLLMEFQSRSDEWMALRLLAYVALLYQDLLKSREVRRAGELPPVFPLVLYNGLRRWRAPLNMDALMGLAPGELGAYRPRFRYFLLDGLRATRGRRHPPGPGGADNLVDGLLRLEGCVDPQQMPGHIIWLHERLRGAEHASLRRALSVYVNRVVVPRVAPDASLPEPADLPETAAMLAETVDAWARKLMKKGRREGRMEGRSDGLRQALLTVLERRFGAVPAGARARIEAAPAESLEAWLVNVLEARSLEEVFRKR